MTKRLEQANYCLFVWFLGYRSHKQGNSGQLNEPRGGSLYQEPEERPLTPM